MKKLTAVSVLLCLFACGVFADISYSALLGAGATLLEGTTTKDDELRANGFLWGRFQLNSASEDGSLGGVLRIKAGLDTLDTLEWNNPDTVWSIYNPYAWAWWMPVEQVKIQLGFIDAFAVNNIVGWEFNGNDAEDYIALAGYEYSGDIFHRSTGFYNGTWWTGASLSVYPINALAINIAIPFTRGNLNQATAGNVYKYIHGQISYAIAGIGKAALSVTGGREGRLDPVNIGAPMGLDSRTNSPTIYASFLLSMLEDMGMGFNIGLAYTPPAKGKDGDITIISNSPAAAGLGFKFDYGEFALKARLAASFAGSTKADYLETLREPFKLGFGLLPSYNFGFCRVYLNTGIAYKGSDEILVGNRAEKQNDSSAFGWHLNPYVTKAIGATTLFAGLYFESDSVYAEGSKVLRWGIPVAIQYVF